MKEIKVNGNDTGLRVFINGVPDLTQVPKEIGKTVINTLEAEIAEWMELKPEEITTEKSSQNRTECSIIQKMCQKGIVNRHEICYNDCTPHQGGLPCN